MRLTMATKLALAASLLVGLCATHWAFGNGGPFVVKYPSGDPAAKGVLARLDPTLKPAQETRLRVVKEDLTVRFGTDRQTLDMAAMPPRVAVTAAYTIENPTGEEVQVDFGFPILRGIYLIQGMGSYPDARVMIDKEHLSATVISNSAIYGMIRQNARKTIEKGITGDPELARLVAAVRAAWTTLPPPASSQPAASPLAQMSQRGGPAAAPPPVSKPAERKPTADYLPARESLRKYLTGKREWNERNAALLVEYASMDFGQGDRNPRPSRDGRIPRDRWDAWVWSGAELDLLKALNLGALAAIGEQKATQLFAQLASRFDKEAAGTYEAIFAAWGGDVRERSIDLETGEVRPREVNLPPPLAAVANPALRAQPDLRLTADPTVYARVDYLDPNAKLTAEEKASCQAVLKNLPVVFTFAPMNLLHYQAKFPAHATRVVTVSYSQYASADTRGTGSYQLAYVLHPATLWKEFGPIQLKVDVPIGIACRASVAMQKESDRNESKAQQAAQPAPFALDDLASAKIEGPGKRIAANATPKPRSEPVMEVYKVTLQEPREKQGELFIAVDKAAWDKMFPAKELRPTPTAKRAVPLRSNPPAQPAAQARPQRAAVGP